MQAGSASYAVARLHFLWNEYSILIRWTQKIGTESMDKVRLSCFITEWQKQWGSISVKKYYYKLVPKDVNI